MKISRRKLNLLIERYLNEQDEKQYLGFSKVSSNNKALKIKDPNATFMKRALDMLDIPADQRDDYFISKSFYDDFTQLNDVAKTGLALGISSKNDTYRYKKIGSNKYEVLAGTKPAGLGTSFTKEPDTRTSDNTEVDDTSNKTSNTSTSSFDERDYTYEIRGKGTYNNVTGTKLIVKSAEGKIVHVYLIPDSLLPRMIQKRIVGGDYEYVVDEKEIKNVIKQYESLSGKKFRRTSLNTDYESKEVDDRLDQNVHKFIDENSAPIAFELQDMSMIASRAEELLAKWNNDLGSKDQTTDEGAKWIWNNLWRVSNKRMRGSNSEVFLTKYKKKKIQDIKYGNERNYHWSSHFLTACITEDSPSFDEIKIKGSSNQDWKAGYAYPWYVGVKNRRELEKNPDAFIGQTMFLALSKEEIEARSDLGYTRGMMTFNSYGGSRDDFGSVKKIGEHTGGYHMNVITSPSQAIGGNIGDKIDYNNRRGPGKAPVYFASVMIKENPRLQMA